MSQTGRGSLVRLRESENELPIAAWPFAAVKKPVVIPKCSDAVGCQDTHYVVSIDDVTAANNPISSHFTNLARARSSFSESWTRSAILRQEVDAVARQQ